MEKRTRERTPRVGLLVLLKTFQRLGYFVMLSDVPLPILEHVAQCAGYEAVHEDLIRYGASSVRRRHMLLVRDYVGVKAWGEEALQAMQSASRDAARTLEDLADIINFALEQLVRQRFELPASRKNNLLLIVFQEFLAERLGGSLAFPLRCRRKESYYGPRRGHDRRNFPQGVRQGVE